MAGGIGVERQRDGAVAVVTLRSVERRNAVSLAMWRELQAVFGDFAHDGRLRAVLLRGDPAGGAFSAGADLSEFPEVRGTPEATLAYTAQTRVTLGALYDCPVPLLALIDGPCVGGGLELAVTADLRLGTERASFGLPAVRLSNAATLEDIRRLTQIAGPAVAAEILFSAATVSAERAYQVGLLNWLGRDAEALEAAAEAIVERIVAAAPRAVRLAKEGLRLVLRPAPDADERYEAGVRRVLGGRNFQEGARAFLEGRRPEFDGED